MVLELSTERYADKYFLFSWRRYDTKIDLIIFQNIQGYVKLNLNKKSKTKKKLKISNIQWHTRIIWVFTGTIAT